ncbi:hypothetical protein N9242_07525 [Vicingaceae bacterium]|nr:hypothetical protein [Vicingaceae bacterium]
MKKLSKISFITILLVTILISCSKSEKEGCTDEVALNYSNLAVNDDGSCEYLDSTFTIWENGQLSYWGDPITGGFEVKSCVTDTTTILLNPDTTITLADTLIDNLVTPPDTTITPGDTTIIGDTYLLVNSDNSGNYKLIIQLLNKQGATDFKNGNLIFKAKLHPHADINNFEVIIHGNHLNSGGINCDDFHFSDPKTIPSTVLDTNNFKEVSIPLVSFTNRHMQNIDLVFGIKGDNAAPNTPLIIISSIKWEVKNGEN